MLFFTRPTEQRIRDLLGRQQDQPFSYVEAGATRSLLPSRYKVLHEGTELGRGQPKFTAASEALRRWIMVQVPNFQFYWPTIEIQEGHVVALLASHFGCWSLNFCRIVYVIDEDGPVRRFGFAYGTLAEHEMRGEERFMVEWDRASDLVTYDILSFSRPANWRTALAYPLARRLQKRFVRNSLHAMVRAVRRESSAS